MLKHNLNINFCARLLVAGLVPCRAIVEFGFWLRAFDQSTLGSMGPDPQLAEQLQCIAFEKLHRLIQLAS